MSKYTQKELEEFAEEAMKAVEYDLVAEVIAEFTLNVKNNPSMKPTNILYQYGLHKIAAYAAQIARAQALGIDPEDLRVDEGKEDEVSYLAQDREGNVLSISEEGVELHGKAKP